MPVTLGLLGAGTFAREAHLPALKPLIAANAARVAAVWSRTAAPAAALAAAYAALAPNSNPPDALHGPDGADALLARADVDAVILAVPIAELAPLALRALRAGKHVLAEKPLASSEAEARAALEQYAAIRPADRRPLYCVAENFRCEEAVARAAAAARALGRTISVDLVAHCVMRRGSKYARGWRLDGGNDVYGQMLDGGVHYVAGLRVAAGADVVRLAARTRLCSDHLPGVDTAHALVEFGNGVSGTFVCSFAAENFKWELTVLCRGGRVLLRRAVVGGTGGYTLQVERADGTTEPEQFLAFCGVESEFHAFVRSVAQGEVDGRISAQAAFNDLAVITSLVVSSETGQFVDVPRV